MKLYHRKVLPSIPKRGKQQTVQRFVQGKTARNVHNDNIQAAILTGALKEKQTLSEQRNYGMIMYQRNLVWKRGGEQPVMTGVTDCGRTDPRKLL